MIARLKTIAVATLLCALAGAPLGAQTTGTPESRLAMKAVEGLPIGATVKLRLRDGERLDAVLLWVEETGIRVKPATRVPEPSRFIAFDRIEQIERHQDLVSIRKYLSVGSAIGGAVMIVLLTGI